MIRHIKLYGTTSDLGALTVTADLAVEGLLYAIEWIDGTFADGVDAVLSVVRDDDAADVTLLTLTDANDDKIYRPLYQACDNLGADLTTTGGEEIFTQSIINGKLKLVVSSGGDTKSGGCIVYYEA